MSKNRSGQGKRKRSRNKSSKNRKNRSQAKKNIELAEVEPVIETSEKPIDTADNDSSNESLSTDFCDVEETEADTPAEEPEADTVAEQATEDKPAEEADAGTDAEQAAEHEEVETVEPEIKHYAEPPVKKTVKKF